MGQKVHPTGYRLGTVEPWRSRWYANKKNFGALLLQDKKIREHIAKEFGSAGIPRVEIERTGEAVNVIIYSARPGVLVGRKGVRVEALKKELQDISGKTCHLTLHEVKRPELESKLVAEVIAEALEKLDDRSKAIVTRRWLTEPKATLHELADEYGVSAERIRQIESNAFRSMKTAFAS